MTASITSNIVQMVSILMYSCQDLPKTKWHLISPFEKGKTVSHQEDKTTHQCWDEN